MNDTHHRSEVVGAIARLLTDTYRERLRVTAQLQALDSRERLLTAALDRHVALEREGLT